MLYKEENTGDALAAMAAIVINDHLASSSSMK
jgi:hypothetical protein